MTSAKRWAHLDKPHLFKRDGLWFCKLGIYSQVAQTPIAAYDKRMAQR